MRMGERTKRVLALLTAGAMVFTNTGMDVLASTSIVVGGITSGEDKKDETPTESESESETGTEQESESESETGSEAESEAAYTDQKVFTCEGDQATVTVTVPDEAQMPAGTELEVQPVVENSVTYEEIGEALSNESQIVLGISAFHMSFVSDERNSLPEDINYKVEIDYNDAVLALPEEMNGMTGNIGTYVNLSDIAADIQTNESGAVTKVVMTTDSLGDVAVVRTIDPNSLIMTTAMPVTEEANEYVMTLDEARQTTIKFDRSEVADTAWNSVQNKAVKVKFVYYDQNGEEVTGINPETVEINQPGQGKYLGNELNNVDRNRVAYVKVVLDEYKLAETFYTLSDEKPVKNGNELVFKLSKRTFEPDDVWESGSLTYVAVGPEHQYNLSGALGLITYFHAVGFTRVENDVHTNGNILTADFQYGSNFGTNGLNGEISYIRSFSRYGNSYGLDNSILVIGKDIDVTCDGSNFYLNGHKVDKPKVIYQDTAKYQYMNIATAKKQAEQLSKS